MSIECRVRSEGFWEVHKVLFIVPIVYGCRDTLRPPLLSFTCHNVLSTHLPLVPFVEMAASNIPFTVSTSSNPAIMPITAFDFPSFTKTAVFSKSVLVNSVKQMRHEKLYPEEPSSKAAWTLEYEAEPKTEEHV
jgi:hypothetical protein